MSDVELAAVESFALDHTKVLAPYVRLIGVEHGPKGDAISNFDIRLVQPNAGEIPTAGLHTIEHTIAALLRTRFDGLIDISPFGCRTGFHMIVWGEPSSTEVAAAIKTSLTDLVERVEWDDVPGTTAESCGNYRDHSLHSAKEWSKQVLAQGISVDAFDRSVIA
ncbi:S-ribosylhomocysteine lyase [Leucobacter aridicollis]|uniref:S-ribosylhomocysteine lyase n=1 Tax=Leucobacter aridicollis TaxID=283878 RepID=UPI000EB5B936|nr:S-ribosylhomocysteine lyase [Leucobacter aridicollis]MCS3429364.1 S-ribosylhomocysteine lyase [Leucobacter aridicollis]RKQ89674.1 S-ribosylhomocysteine lyase /quorum-sensing autoinducer 2 (AI-2) synthesis protein LuxS [Mycolicibacterium mucogenicum 261Sha1.1M5]